MGKVEADSMSEEKVPTKAVFTQLPPENTFADTVGVLLQVRHFFLLPVYSCVLALSATFWNI